VDLEGYWQENKRFVLTVAGGAVAFLVGWWALDAYLGSDLRSLESRRSRLQRELGAPMFQAVDLDRASAQNAELREAVATLRQAAEFRPRPRFALTDGVDASSRYVTVVSEVREDLLTSAGRAGLVLPQDLGLPTLAPTKETEIARTLEALDALERVLQRSIEAGCERVDSIRIELDARLLAGKPIDDLEKTVVQLRLVGSSIPIVRLLTLLQEPRSGDVLLVERAEVAPARARRDEVRLDLEIALVHPHGLGALADAQEGG